MPELMQNSMPTVDAIERARAAESEPRHGYRLPASKIGGECVRAIFYSFWWLTPAKAFDGRLLRLFETGNVEEDRLIEDLRRAGFTVNDRDEHDPEKQIGVAFSDGHGYGYLDAEVVGIPEAPKTIHVAEFKSHNDKNFARLKKLGVKAAFPEHYGQMQLYMHLRGRTRALYLAVNKNDDQLYSERINYDFQYCVDMEERGRRIVYDTAPPARISDKADFWKCRFCDHSPVCHDGEVPAVNCRTCIYADACTGGAWLCARHGKTLDRAAQNAACQDHLFNPNFLSGTQADADLKAGWISYAMPDGSTWTNYAAGRDQ